MKTRQHTPAAMPPAASIRALGTFALAQVFPEHHALAAIARQVLVPCAWLPRPLRVPAPYRPVAVLLKDLGDEAAKRARLVAEVWEYRMTTAPLRLGGPWPPLRRAALYAAHGLAEPVALAALALEAAAARREAAKALAGPAVWEECTDESLERPCIYPTLSGHYRVGQSPRDVLCPGLRYDRRRRRGGGLRPLGRRRCPDAPHGRGVAGGSAGVHHAPGRRGRPAPAGSRHRATAHTASEAHAAVVALAGGRRRGEGRTLPL